MKQSQSNTVYMPTALRPVRLVPGDSVYQRGMDFILSKVRLGSMGACLPRRCVHACIRTHTHKHTHTHTHAIQHTLTGTLPFVNASGKVNLENAVTRWKCGVVRLIAESTKTPIVIPLWHIDMEDILSASRSPLIPSTVQSESSKAYTVKLMHYSWWPRLLSCRSIE